MPNTPNTSFIPKQGPVRRPRQTASRNVHVLSVFAYMTFASALVASVGVFFYQKHVETQLQDQIAELDAAISGFSEDDMGQVKEFNNRLTQAKDRIEKGVSIVAIFDALEASVLQAVSFEKLNLVRAESGDIELEATVRTDSFDSALFQRGVFERSSIVNSMSVEDLTLEAQIIGEEEEAITSSGVTFIAEIGVLASSVPNIPKASAPTSEFSLTEDVDVATSTASSTDTVSVEEEVDEVNDVAI